MVVVIHGQADRKWHLCMCLYMVSFPLPTMRKDETASLVLSRCDWSLPQCVHAFLISPLFICQNTVSPYISSGFLGHYSGKLTNFYLDPHKTVTTRFFSLWHSRKISFRVNQRHCNLFCVSWGVCLYAFLALHLPPPPACTYIYTFMCTNSCLDGFITFLPTACSGFLPQFWAEGSGRPGGSMAPVCKFPTCSPSKPSHVPPATATAVPR